MYFNTCIKYVKLIFNMSQIFNIAEKKSREGDDFYKLTPQN